MVQKNRCSIIFLCFTLSIGLVFSLVGANPYFNGGEVSPPSGTQPPKVSVTLENNSLFLSSNISFKVTASSSDPINFTDKYTYVTDPWFITDVWYTVDWKEGNTSVIHNSHYAVGGTTNLFRYVNLTNIPEGNHTLKMFVNEYGTYVNNVYTVTKYFFNINSSLLVNFVVDTIKPTISFSEPLQNITFDAKDVAFNFTINKPDCQIFYSLDNQSETIANSVSSITLSNLINGEHNVTIYSKDIYGVISEPNTIYFDVKVPEPFPTTNFAIVSGIILVIIVGIVSLLFYKKHRKTAKPS
jgi:hypothetical protein